jgi:hypothetical protein
MKKVMCLLPLLFCLLESVSCTQGTLTRNSYYIENKVVAEGTVKYSRITGVYLEESEHSGYYLSDPEWFVRPRDIKSSLFFDPNIDMTYYLNKKVHVEGSMLTMPGRKVSPINYIMSYQYISVDTMRVID